MTALLTRPPQPLTIAPGQHVLLPGAGLVGSLAALYLARRGMRCTLLDKRPRPTPHSLIEARSINLALSHRGFAALQALGLQDIVAQVALPMEGRIVHDPQGGTQFMPYGQKGQAIYSVSRANLNRVLIEACEATEGIQIEYLTRATGVDFERTLVRAQTPQGERVFAGDAILACDGAYSAIRQAMQVSDRFNFSQEYIDHGYQEFHLAPYPDGRYQMDPGGLHIWPRRNFMMIALPNPDGSFTCTLFLAWEGRRDSFEALQDPLYRAEFFVENFPDLVERMPDYDEQFLNNPVSSLVTIRCSPWHRDRVQLLGDAAHAIVPFYGQGMNAGFEDVVHLMSRLDEILQAGLGTGTPLTPLADDRAIDMPAPDTWEGLFRYFSIRRRPQADAIAALALDNFIEMRDKVADPAFIWQKKIEGRLAALLPGVWVPLYTMVSFTSTPYDMAQEKGAQQTRIAQRIMSLPKAPQRWTDDQWLLEAYHRLTKQGLPTPLPDVIHS